MAPLLDLQNIGITEQILLRLTRYTSHTILVLSNCCSTGLREQISTRMIIERQATLQFLMDHVIPHFP